MIPLHFPFVTSATAGLLGLVLVALSVRVVVARGTTKVMLGEGKTDDGTSPLLVAIRGHANFTEYVPLCLILIATIELRSGATLLVKVLDAALVLARMAHPIGLAMRAPNPLRAAGFAGTILVLLAASVAVLAAAL